MYSNDKLAGPFKEQTARDPGVLESQINVILNLISDLNQVDQWLDQGLAKLFNPRPEGVGTGNPVPPIPSSIEGQLEYAAGGLSKVCVSLREHVNRLNSI